MRNGRRMAGTARAWETRRPGWITALATMGAMLVLLSLVTIAAASPAQWTREGWTTDFSRMSVEPNEILSGGPPKDGIPSIDDPAFRPVSEETELVDREPVVGLEIDGDARAYPLRILTWHEIVNDTVGGRPVIVTYCPLCNAALVFDRTLDGEPVEFGTTGKLRKSDLVMYDRRTESWWQQFTGEAIAGARLGDRLDLLPSRLESWGEFKARHPDGRVLRPPPSVRRDYGRNPYTGYDTASRPFLYRGDLPEGIEPMQRVVVVRDAAGEPDVVSLTVLREKGTLDLDGTTLSWREGQASALDTTDIREGRDVGTVVAQRDGVDVPYDVTFAFVAHAFHPEVTIRTE